MVHGTVPIGPLSARRGLRWEILVSLGVLMLGGVAFMGVTALKAAERAIVLSRVEALAIAARSIQSALTADAQPGGAAGKDLQGYVDRTAASMDLASLVVADRAGRVIAAAPPHLRKAVSTDPYLARALEAERLVLPTEVPGSQGTWTFAAPFSAGGKVAGAFAASFPAENLWLTLRVHRKIVFAFAVLDALVILAFGIWLIGRVAIRPMVQIADGARALAQGDYGARVAEAGPREIASLARSFNEMADRVQAAVRKQEEHLAALQGANEKLQKAQSEILRIEKLASVGRLSAGVAHEIGNPLAAVLGYTALLLKSETDAEKAAFLRHIEQETERIGRIIRGLLDFARPRESRVEDIRVNDLVRFTLDLVRPQKDFAEVKVDLSLAEGLPPVRGDHHQLVQAMVNVLVNGAQAMDGRGRLEVETSLRRLGEDDLPMPKRRATDPSDRDFASLRGIGAAVPALAAGDAAVSVTIRDAGKGIAPEILNRIFDPFFTTKEPGEGTGLGLSITHGIVEAHGGRLRVQSRRGEGTEVIIELPACEGEKADAGKG